MESKPRHHIVQAEWVIESVREGYALEESDFTAILKSQTG